MAALSPQQTGKGRAGGPLYTAGTVVTPLVVYVDPRAARLVSSSSTSDFAGVDPRAATLVR